MKYKIYILVNAGKEEFMSAYLNKFLLNKADEGTLKKGDELEISLNPNAHKNVFAVYENKRIGMKLVHLLEDPRTS